MSDRRPENIVDACKETLKSGFAANFLAEIKNTLTDAQQEIDAHNPVCDACGRCCKFDVADHRLYVSTGELALLVSSEAPKTPANLRCEWQTDGNCLARNTRPLGCRVFYCKTELSVIYEKFHRKIVDIHKKYGVSYFYAEMTSTVMALRRGFAEK